MNSKNSQISIGATVRIAPQHWRRGYEEAVVVGFAPGNQNNWLVQFNCCYPGGGIWLDESQLTHAKHEFSSRRGTHASASSSFGREGRELQ